MVKIRTSHFDEASLVKAIFSQPIGLRVSTNHAEGFRRLLYLFMRRNPQAGRVHILQCPKSASAFLLVRSDFQLQPNKEPQA